VINPSKALHHRTHKYKKQEYQHPEKIKRFYDKFIYLVVIIAPIANIPQLLKVWVEKDVSGVSSLSWFLFSGISITWLIYGILHRDKHILLMNAALMVIQALIALGAIIYS
jgi:uncharacterized protein with PQ loop repeat